MSVKEPFHDINKLPTDGYIIFPISMSRISNAQDAKNCYKAIQFLETKMSLPGVDGIFLYTNGLYYNNEESGIVIRKKTNQQMIDHRNSILKLVNKNKKYLPQAMHFIPWDYVLLNSADFSDFLARLKRAFIKDSNFSYFLREDLKERKETEANIAFLIEEIVLNHIIRQKLVDFPKTLVRQDKFRLFVYPGAYMKADLYQWKNKLLPQKQIKNSNSNPYYASQYDLDRKILYDFDKVELSLQDTKKNN